MNAAPNWSNVEQLRAPPCSVEAEQAVLGGLMLAPGALAKVSDWLKPEDFYRRDHQMIYTAILALAEKEKPYDAVTLGEWFEAQGQGDHVEGGAYLIGLAATTPSAANIVAYAEIVRDKSKRRECIAHGTDLVNASFSSGRDTDEIIAEHSIAITQLRGDARAGGLMSASAGLNDWFDDLHKRYESGSSVTGMPYPWHEVNSITHGLQPGELTIIAARPSMGKSIMGLNLAMFTALRGHNTAFFSLEMTTRQCNRRNISALGEVPHDWLLAPNKDHDYWPRVTDAIRKLKGAPLLVDESAGLNVAQIVARARRAHMQRPIELLVVDHLHDMDYSGKQEMRHQIGAAVAAFKKLGKDFGCPVVILAQLNRSLEARTDKRPMMPDLREAGDIEQKADVIWFLYREDYYNRNSPGYQPQHDVELILGKGRDLMVGAPTILRADYGYMALRDWEVDSYGSKPSRGAPQRQARGGFGE